MNPEVDCPNVPDPLSAYAIVYNGGQLVLCKECGPAFQYKAMMEKMKPQR